MPEDYAERLEAWHDARVQELTHPTGWMRLAGLHWLEEGTQSFGSSDEEADIAFAGGSLPSVAGLLRMSGDSVWVTAAEGTELRLEGEPLAPGEQTLIHDPVTGYAPMIASGTLEWLIIQREDLVGIRLYDHENPLADAFDGFDRFPIDSLWHVKAMLMPHRTPTQLAVTNILGQTTMVDSPGTLHFDVLAGDSYRLVPMMEGDKMFIVFGDLTNGKTTYDSGRYLYADMPPEGSNITILDFNLAYNPPCSYTSYSTCQLPPPSNRMNIAVKAGELAPGPEYR